MSLLFDTTAAQQLSRPRGMPGTPFSPSIVNFLQWSLLLADVTKCTGSAGGNARKRAKMGARYLESLVAWMVSPNAPPRHMSLVGEELVCDQNLRHSRSMYTYGAYDLQCISLVPKIGRRKEKCTAGQNQQHEQAWMG